MKRTSLNLCILIGTLGLGSIASAQVFVNFGDLVSGDPNATDLEKTWNNAGGSTDIADLLDLDGLSSGASLTWVVGFYGNTGGLNADVDDFVAAANARASYSRLEPTLGLTFSGLNSSSTYDFSFLAFRSGSSDTRSGTYTFSGLTTEAIEVDAAVANTLNTVTITPDASGNVSLGIVAAPSNSSGGYVYLNAMSITAVPEVASFPLFAGLVGILGLLVRRRRTQ